MRSPALKLLDVLSGRKDLPQNPLLAEAMIRTAERYYVEGRLSQMVAVGEGGQAEVLLKEARLEDEHRTLVQRAEVKRIARDLIDYEGDVLLLKGSAYLEVGSEAALGRRVSDVDVLVPKADLEIMEQYLLGGNWDWDTKTDNPYDHAYYCKWTHELPPLRHKTRQTLLDVHHAILSPTGRSKPQSALLWKDAVQTDGRFFVLSPLDRFMHSAAHIFHDGEFSTPIRSLIELHDLWNDLDAGARAALPGRAKTLDLVRPTQIALAVLAHYLPGEELTQHLVKLGRGNPIANIILLKMCDAVLAGGRRRSLAARGFIARGHWRRMPPWLLAYHSLAKVLRKAKKETPSQ